MNNIRPKNPLRWIKYKILEWKWDRVLKKYRTWDHYQRANDADFCITGRTVRDQLRGYPFVALVRHHHLEYTLDPLFGPIEHCQKIIEWCKSNCRKKFRHHWERVIVDHAGQYLPNGIGGSDELFFGFKDQRDYMLFLIRWG